MKTLGILSSVVALSLLQLIPTQAHAADGMSVKLEPGLAIPMGPPQNDRFDPGISVFGKASIGILPFLDVGPSASTLALPSKINGIDTGTAFGIGFGFRVKRPHDRSNTGQGFSAISPWADADAQYLTTGKLDRAGLSFAVGASVPTSDARNLWLGPFVRYQDVVQMQKPGFDSTDAHILIAGVSLEIGGKVHREDYSQQDSDNDGVKDTEDACPYIFGVPELKGCPRKMEEKKSDAVSNPKEDVATPPVLPQFDLKQTVQFDVNSFSLSEGAKSVMAEIVSTMLKDADFNISVEGHASSDGNKHMNDVLAANRAKAVVDYLASIGVPRDHMTYKGFGSSVPLESNDTMSGRIANRRVEFVIKINDGEVK